MVCWSPPFGGGDCAPLPRHRPFEHGWPRLFGWSPFSRTKVAEALGLFVPRASIAPPVVPRRIGRSTDHADRKAAVRYAGRRATWDAARVRRTLVRAAIFAPPGSALAGIPSFGAARLPAALAGGASRARATRVGTAQAASIGGAAQGTGAAGSSPRRRCPRVRCSAARVAGTSTPGASCLPACAGGAAASRAVFAASGEPASGEEHDRNRSTDASVHDCRLDRGEPSVIEGTLGALLSVANIHGNVGRVPQGSGGGSHSTMRRGATCLTLLPLGREKDGPRRSRLDQSSQSTSSPSIASWLTS